jgi:hypothetical protein
MVKSCPECVRTPMLLFDAAGQNEIYNKQAPDRQESVFDNQRIDWGRWPWEGPPVPNNWACPRCGHHEEIGPDILAQQEFRPRLF